MTDWVTLRSDYLRFGSTLFSDYRYQLPPRNCSKPNKKFYPRIDGFGKVPSAILCLDFLVPRWLDSEEMNYDEYLLFKLHRTFTCFMPDIGYSNTHNQWPESDLISTESVIISPARTHILAQYLETINIENALEYYDFFNASSYWNKDKAIRYCEKLTSFWIEAGRNRMAIIHGIY